MNLESFCWMPSNGCKSAADEPIAEETRRYTLCSRNARTLTLNIIHFERVVTLLSTK